MCLHYVLCFEALKGIADLVSASPVFPERAQSNVWLMRHCGGGRQGVDGCGAQEQFQLWCGMRNIPSEKVRED